MPIAQLLLELMGEPVMTTTLRLHDADEPFMDPHAIQEAIGKQVEVILAGGIAGVEGSTVVDLTGAVPEIVRQGLGDLDDI